MGFGSSFALCMTFVNLLISLSLGIIIPTKILMHKGGDNVWSTYFSYENKQGVSPEKALKY